MPLVPGFLNGGAVLIGPSGNGTSGHPLKSDGTGGAEFGALTPSDVGAVDGPGSSTDNAVARFDGTTGHVLQNSGATIDDSGNIAANNLSGTNTGDQTIALTGDVTGSGTGTFAATIANDAVTNAKAANVPANTLKGNASGSTADPSDLAVGDVTEEAAPDAGDFLLGFLATGELRKFDIDNLPSAGGAGDFVGPASSTDNSIVRFDGTTGKLGQNSAGAILGDNANLTLTAQAGASTPLSVVAHGSQSSDLVSIQNSSAAKQVWLDSAGRIWSIVRQLFTVSTSSTWWTAIHGYFADDTSRPWLRIGFTSSTSDTTGQAVNAGMDASVTVLGIGNGSVAGTDNVGPVATSPVAGRLIGTSGSGSNVAGGSLAVSGGRNTGNANGGSVVIQTSPPGSSGATLGTLTDRVIVDTSGNLLLKDRSTAPGTPSTAVALTSDAGVLKARQSDGTDVTYARLQVSQEYTKAQNFDQTTLTDGANISWDVDSNQVAVVTLGGNRTLDNPTNIRAGGTYILIVKQDGTGGRTLAFGTTYKFPGGIDPTLSTGANDVDVLSFVSDGTSMFGVWNGDFS